MTLSISVGSGKGGTGKSMVIANMAMLLARAGRRVCIVDLDLGGPDAHILYGLIDPQRTLTHFLSREIEDINELVYTFEYFGGVQLIAGTGDTLQSANMTFQQKQRLLRSLATLETDILLIDVGAGSSYHALDFFMYTDIQICVTSPEPTSIMDFYNFLQLATIRKAVSSFLSQGEVGRHLKGKKFKTLSEMLDLAETLQPGGRKLAQQALHRFNPLLVVNKVSPSARINLLKLRSLAAKYLGIYLPDLGQIPYDDNVQAALRAYLPVVEFAPNSPAAKSLVECSDKLLKVIDLYLSKRAV